MVVDSTNLFGEVGKLWDDKLILEGLWEQRDVILHNPAKDVTGYWNLGKELKNKANKVKEHTHEISWSHFIHIIRKEYKKMLHEICETGSSLSTDTNAPLGV